MLKSLELFGFKSFAERTVFEFAPGITCVVGPNGSGKSNVVDAIKWILGDQSAKSLRGKEMSDVIFNGSTGRKPSQFAEASLGFDNTTGLLPIEAREVQIGRRLYRGGDSEYLLNGNVVRLKDVRDLLLGTGAGTAAYSIIEQGRVDQILQSNPASRRQVFEEAAGISRFKAKRVDAERRLERVSQNLLRLTDIVDEIESQLNATRSQATKASKYRELSQELRALWTGLAADDCRQWSAVEAGIEESLQAGRLRAEEIQTQLSAIETDRRGIDSEMTVSEGGIRDTEQQIAGLRQSIATSTANMRHQSQRSDELVIEIEQLSGQQIALAGEASLAERELAETALRLQRLEESIRDRRRAFDEQESVAREVQQKLAASREEARSQRVVRQQTADACAQTQQRLASIQSQRTASEEAVAELTHRRDAAQSRAEVVEQAAEEAGAALERIEGEAAAVRDRRDQRLKERTRMASELTELELLLGQRREQRSQWHARWLVLQQWDQHHTGVGLGVRDILERAAESQESPWNTVRGLVGSLLEAPLEYAPIIDLVLGSRTQAIVVDRLEPWIEHWRSSGAEPAGRIVFLSLEEGVRRTEDLAALSGGRGGVIARANEVVSESEEAPGLAARLLSDVWIVQDLPSAMKLIRQSGGGVDCVTLQGELLHRDGRLTLGPPAAESAFVSRRSELRQLALDLRRLDRSIDEDTRKLAEWTAAHVARDQAVQQADAELRVILERAAAAKASFDIRDQERQRLVAERQKLDDQLSAATTRGEELAQEIAALGDEIVSLQDQTHCLDETLSALQGEIDFVDQELRTLLTEIDRERIELVKQEERLRGLTETQERFDRDQSVRLRQQEEAEVRLRQSHDSLNRAQLLVLAASAEISSLTVQVESLQVTLRDLESQRASIRSRRQELIQQEEVLRKQRHAVVDEIHSAEMKLRELSQQRSALEARMQEEYQLTLDDVVALNVSAYEQHLAAHGHGAAEDAQPESIEGETDEPEPQAWSAGVPPTFEEVRPELEGQVERLRRRIKSLGHVNTEALNDLEELEQRFGDLSGQLHDLQEAKSALEDIIRRINVESRKLFLETFESIRTHFRELFRKLFGGGEGEIVLENPDDVLECGIDIVARPPGKELRSISLLSGGEKTLTAIALLFAMFKSKPSPYCVLDEVDAALDEANVERYASIVRDFASMTQFVVITHRKRTMTSADALYGVTMEQAGISKRMSVRFEEVGENGEIKSAGSRAA